MKISFKPLISISEISLFWNDNMKPKLYKLIEYCVESGAIGGYRHAFKHDDNPPEDVIVQNIVDRIMLEFSEWFTFDDEHE